ncbi:GIN domain-containing protein [Phenylobacterium sp.]|uniref:GIN domain-containing protein n=1 Tax=Phenylobacterium sp. TaxID=1871053 RepID=UPI003BA90305
MIRLLVIIAVVGFLTAVVTLGGAAALGGRDIAAQGWDHWSDHDWGIGWDEHGRRHSDWRNAHRNDPEWASATREIAWDGASALILDVPGEVTFTQGSEGPGKLTVTGPKRAIDTLALSGGRLSDGVNNTGERLRIVMTAPKVTRFELKGVDRLTLEGYDQDSLEISTSGMAKVTARGKTGTLKLHMTGAGEADLAGLDAESAEVDISGAAEAAIAPRASAKLDISGSGEVELKTRPLKLEKNVSGSGEVKELES